MLHARSPQCVPGVPILLVYQVLGPGSTTPDALVLT
jgi:hypothetical protein